MANPFVADAVQTVRSMALEFELPDGEEWRTGMNSIPVFVVSTPEAFRDQLVATRPDRATGKPDPTKVQAFLASHPSRRRRCPHPAAPISSGFGNSTYNGLNAFQFVNAGTRRHPSAGRWCRCSPSPAHATDPSRPTRTLSSTL